MGSRPLVVAKQEAVKPARAQGSVIGAMLFSSKREKTIKCILIVEDEPLVAFDNEHFLRDAGYDVTATVDTVKDALAHIGRNGIDLVLADVRLSDGGDGQEVAVAASKHGVPVLFVTGTPPDGAADFALGVLSKPYNQRDLLATIEAIEAQRNGRKPKRLPKGLTLF